MPLLLRLRDGGAAGGGGDGNAAGGSVVIIGEASIVLCARVCGLVCC